VGGDLTIDELAVATGMTVRNIRAHQSRGLLPPPRIVGRTGYYGPAHVRRLDQIRRMQDEGLNLAAIAKVVSDGRLTDVAVSPFTASDAEPEFRDPGELIERLRLEPGDPAITRAIEMGLISFEGDRVRLHSPRLLHVAEELVDQGVPLLAMLEAVQVVAVASRQVADAFMALADEHLVARVAVDSGGDLDQIREAVERLRVYAREALTALFDQAMAGAIRTSFEPGSGEGTPSGDRA
jgi:DNA-binding transcriptional MerR regulator